MENKFCRLYGYLRCFHWLTASALIEFEFWQLNVFLLFKIFYSNLCDKLVICAPVLYCHFYRMSICASMVLAVVILSVCLSVCPSVTHALWQNQTMHCRYFDTTRKGNHSSFPTPTVVAGWRPLSSDICVGVCVARSLCHSWAIMLLFYVFIV